MIKVILCDDHALIRRGIRDTLSDSEDIEVVGEAGDYGELRALLRDKSCDVLVRNKVVPEDFKLKVEVQRLIEANGFEKKK